MTQTGVQMAKKYAAYRYSNSKYGLEFCEIPRFALDEKRVINATEVRRLLKERDFESIKEYVPETTVRILKEKY